MTFVQILLIIIVAVPFALVFTNRLKMDTAGLAIAALLGIAQYAGLGMLDAPGKPESAIKSISGFGQPVVVTLIGLFILTRLLETSGITRSITGYLLRFGGQSTPRLIGLFAGATAFLSLFMNNIAAGALLLPSALEAARRTGIRPSKLLMPVAYGSMLGGAATYFTTANILASNLLTTASPPQQPLNILDFTPTGGLIAIAGILFMALAGSRLLPDRPPSLAFRMVRPTGSELEDVYGIGERLWEGLVESSSPLAGKTLAQAAFGERLGISVPAILRGSRLLFPLTPTQVIFPADRLLLIGREERVMPLLEEGLSITTRAGDHISVLGLMLIEITPAPRSNAVGKTLKEIAFRRKYGYTALAILRRGRSYRTNVSDYVLEPGDSLLIVGPQDAVSLLRHDPDFLVLEPSLGDQPLDKRKAYISIAVVAAAVTASIIGMPIYLAMLTGAVLVILLRLITIEDAYRAIEWQAIFLIAGMYTVSLAMVQTGLAERMGEWMLKITTPFGPLGLAAGAYLLAGLLTQVIGGQVSILVAGPVVISAALTMNTNPQAVAVAAAIGCSASFLTPMSHPVNILMIAPGNYTFNDFTHVGWRLTVLSFAMLLIGLLLFWKL